MKKSFILILMFALSMLFLSGCSVIYQVKYEIKGTDVINISYYDANEARVELKNIQLPWSETFIGKKGNMAFVTYSRVSINQPIISRILVNNKVRESFYDNPYDMNLRVGIMDII